MQRAVLSALGERDENASVCVDAKGQPGPPGYRERPPGGVGRRCEGRRCREGGYEINFNRYFYTYTPPRPLAEIEAEIKSLEAEILGMVREMMG